MADEEIEKAMKYCKHGNPCHHGKEVCPLYCDNDDNCHTIFKLYKKLAHLQNAGIGDKKQAIKEFAEKLKERSFWLADSNGRSHKVIYVDDVDNLITKLYGADKGE